jgi:hypothetical protein
MYIFKFDFHLEQMISMRKLAILSVEFTFLRKIFYLSSFSINYLFTPLSTDQAKKLISQFMIQKFLQEIHQDHMIVHMITNISSRSIPLLKKVVQSVRLLFRAAAIPWENRSASQLERDQQLIELYTSVPRDLLIRVYRNSEMPTSHDKKELLMFVLVHTAVATRHKFCTLSTTLQSSLMLS